MYSKGDIVEIIGSNGHYIPIGMHAEIKNYHPKSDVRDKAVYFLTTDCGHEQLVYETDFIFVNRAMETNESAVRFLKRSDSDV